MIMQVYILQSGDRKIQGVYLHLRRAIEDKKIYEKDFNLQTYVSNWNVDENLPKETLNGFN